MQLKAIEARRIACISTLEMMKRRIEEAAAQGLQKYVQWHAAGDDAAAFVLRELTCAGYTVTATRSGTTGSYYWRIAW